MVELLKDPEAKTEQESDKNDSKAAERKLAEEAIRGLGDKDIKTDVKQPSQLPPMEIIGDYPPETPRDAEGMGKAVAKAIKEIIASVQKWEDGVQKPYPHPFERPKTPSEILYEGKPPEQVISTDDVAQGSYGDCFFEAAVASMANSEKGKQRIEDMIKPNADGSYTVTFPGEKDKPINVTKEDLDNPNIRNRETWANVLETAYLKRINDGTVQKDLGDGNGVNPLADGVGTRKALELLTGEDATTDQFAPTDLGSQQITIGATSPDNVRKDLVEALNKGEPVTAGASLPFTKFIGGHDPGPLVEQHVYSVLGYDEKSGVVTVRNPWGDNSEGPLSKDGATVDGITNAGDGKLEMSFGTYMKYFSDQNVAGANPYINNVEHIAETAFDSPASLVDAAGAALSGDWDKAGSKAVKGLIVDPAYVINELEYAVTKPVSDGLIWGVQGAADLLGDAGDALAGPVGEGQKVVGGVIDGGANLAKGAWEGVTGLFG